MENFVTRMIEEHAQLVFRTTKLHDYVYSERSAEDDRVEFANKCIQLSSMKKYEEALRARLENQGIFYENGQYFNRLGSITDIVTPAIEEKHEENNENREKHND